MTISATAFKARCLALLSQLERRAEPIEITRRGKVIARVLPPAVHASSSVAPWARLRGSGRLLATPEESVLSEEDFDAAR